MKQNGDLTYDRATNMYRLSKKGRDKARWHSRKKGK
jgi:hypothetical protein